MSESPRVEILSRAQKAVTTDRNVDYGEPENNFRDIIDMWAIYVANLKRPLVQHDEAIHDIIIKICRIKQSPGKIDHWVDIAGYAACGYDCVVSEEKIGITQNNEPLTPAQKPETYDEYHSRIANATPNKPFALCKQCNTVFYNGIQVNDHKINTNHWPIDYYK